MGCGGDWAISIDYEESVSCTMTFSVGCDNSVYPAPDASNSYLHLLSEEDSEFQIEATFEDVTPNTDGSVDFVGTGTYEVVDSSPFVYTAEALIAGLGPNGDEEANGVYTDEAIDTGEIQLLIPTS